MKIVTGITTDPKQQMTLILDDGSQSYLYIEYNAQQLGWFMNLQYGIWQTNGIRLTASPNLLRKWVNVVPFGLAILTQGNVDPLNISDFADDTAVMYLLNPTDVANVEANSFAGV